MSYLPNSSGTAGTWAVAWGTSGVLHIGLFGLLLGSYIPFLPNVDRQPPQFESFLVSFEIRDASVIQDIDVPSAEVVDGLDETALPPDDAQLDTIEDLSASLEPEAATGATEALGPQVSPGLAPILDPVDGSAGALNGTATTAPVDTPLAPVAILPDLASEGDAIIGETGALPDSTVLPDLPVDLTTGREQGAAEPPDYLALEETAGQPIAPQTVQPRVTSTVEDVGVQDLQTLPLEAPGTQGVAPSVVQGLIVDDVSIVDDVDVSPLAEGGAVEAPALLPDSVAAPSPLTETLAPTPDAVSPTPLASTNTPLERVFTPTGSTAGLVTTPPTSNPSTIGGTTIIEDGPQPDAAAESFAALVPSELTPSEPLVPLAPSDPGQSGLEPSVLQPDVAFDDTAAVGVDATVISSPSAGQIALGQLLQRIRSVRAPQCALALPRGVAPDGIGLSLIGARDEVVSDYADRLLERDAPAVLQSRELVDARQCPVLDVIRVNEAYPASRIGLSIERTLLSSGDTLRARVIGAGGLYLTALLIDDNGVVQDLGRFASVEGPALILDAPVARTGEVRATRQILLVLGTRDAPLELSDQIGNLAQDVLPSINADVLRTALFGLATFEVR